MLCRLPNDQQLEDDGRLKLVVSPKRGRLDIRYKPLNASGPTFRTPLRWTRSIKFLVSMPQHSDYSVMSFFHVQNNLTIPIE